MLQPVGGSSALDFRGLRVKSTKTVGEGLIDKGGSRAYSLYLLFSATTPTPSS